MQQLAVTDGRGPDDERAIGDRRLNAWVFARAFQYRASPNCGARLAKSHLVGIHQSKISESEVANSAGGSADVQRIAWSDENDSKIRGINAHGLPRTSTQATDPGPPRLWTRPISASGTCRWP